MVKKHLIVASMVLASVCSCLVVGKNVNAAFAKSGNETSPYVVAYEKGDPMWAEFELDEEALKNVPYHELTQDIADDFDYSKVKVDEYAIGDESFTSPAISADDEIHILQEDRGNYIPTSYWNLDNSAYHYSITNMQSYVYTDYYFAPNSQGKIYMSLDSFNSGGNNITIRCYEVSSNSEVAHWTNNPQIYSGLAWTGLSQNKMYYFKFEISSGTLSGSGTIYH